MTISRFAKYLSVKIAETLIWYLCYWVTYVMVIRWGLDVAKSVYKISAQLAKVSIQVINRLGCLPLIGNHAFGIESRVCRDNSISFIKHHAKVPISQW